MVQKEVLLLCAKKQNDFVGRVVFSINFNYYSRCIRNLIIRAFDGQLLKIIYPAECKICSP